MLVYLSTLERGEASLKVVPGKIGNKAVEQTRVLFQPMSFY